MEIIHKEKNRHYHTNVKFIYYDLATMNYNTIRQRLDEVYLYQYQSILLKLTVPKRF